MPKGNLKKELISIKLIKSLNGRKPNHIACAHGLGLKKIGQIVQVIDTPENRGMVNQIPYLITLEG